MVALNIAMNMAADHDIVQSLQLIFNTLRYLDFLFIVFLFVTDATTVIVVMPLVALISQQVESLKSAGYSAIQISGETDIDQLKSTSYTHIFITPEMLNTHLEQIIDDTTVSHVFVDESHCVSNW